jgi:hypothetical protein
MAGTFLSNVETSQHPKSIDSAETNDELFKHFVGNSESADQQKILDFFNKVLDLGINFKSQPQVRQKKLLNPATKSFNSMPEEGISLCQLLECYHEIIQASTNFGSPSFLGFPDAVNSIPALGAAILVPLIYQNMCNLDIQAPFATFVEMEVVHWLRHQLGYPVHRPIRPSLRLEVF